MPSDSSRCFLEFFAGGGLARTGLGAPWRCLWANDIDPRKADAYRLAHGAQAFRLGDVAEISAGELPLGADLAWASFPCQDLSLAGPRGGLAGPRSSLFWSFWRLVQELDAAGTGPALVVLENVRGLATQNGGRDFAAVAEALADSGRWVGCLELDARHFVPQSRPRLFFVAARAAPAWALGPCAWTQSEPLRRAQQTLGPGARARWVSWALPLPPRPNLRLADILEADDASNVVWDPAAKTEHVLTLLAPAARRQVDQALQSNVREVGALFRRMRICEGRPVQRAEVRFDGLAGCLRTPAGGSSRQSVLVIDQSRLRTRRLNAREAARLMGLGDEHPLPAAESQALKVLGDGVAVPVVSWLSKHLLEPLARAAPQQSSAAA